MKRDRPLLIFTGSFDSPLGRIRFASDPAGVVLVQMPVPSDEDRFLQTILQCFGPVPLAEGGETNARFCAQLAGYFSGTLRAFRVPVNARGTPFQKRVWDIVSRIPYGQTRSYGEIASDLGMPGASRAVGQANRRNPLPLLIPCHRVVAEGGRLGGYSSGIDQKRFLLDLEAEASAHPYGPSTLHHEHLATVRKSRARDGETR